MATSVLLCFLSIIIFLLHPLPTKANIHNTTNLLKSHPFTDPITPLSSNLLGNDTPPTVFFEVTKPIDLPKTKPCDHLVLQHDFGYTYGKPPVIANYTPPSHCPSQHFSKIVLEWKATCKGRQFDRIFGVWLGGVELLRSCSAEPRATGIFWTVQKDITRYSSLLLKNEIQEFSVYLGNLVDKTYTGVYHVNVTMYFYPAEKKMSNDNQPSWNRLAHGRGLNADLILPISRNLPLNDGLWFEIESSAASGLKEFKIPQNVYRAVLEVYVSFHENDEFWYGNIPNDYLVANNITNVPGNGPFREVVVSLDGAIVGAVWPFTVIFTGGVNPLLWRPISAIGSFNLPSYDIEITPFLGNILDGKTHRLEFSVTNALNVWYVDANLHLWLDHKRAKTEGKLLRHDNKSFDYSLVSDFKGLNGTFLTIAHRSISSNGWVKSSFGKITTRFNQHLGYSNSMELGKDGNMQIVNQLITFNDTVSFRKVSSVVHSFHSLKTFQFDMYSDNLDQGNGTYLSVANVTLGFNEQKSKVGGIAKMSSLKNLQNGQGVMVVKNNLVISGVGSTQQIYKYNSGKSCYFRNISSSNYTILYDTVGSTCANRKQSYLGFQPIQWWPFPARRASLSSDAVNEDGV